MDSRAPLFLVCLLLSSCDDDGERGSDSSVPVDGGSKADAGATDARVDLDANGDARTGDAAPAPDAGTAGCTLDQKYRFAYVGGRFSWTDYYEFERGYLLKSRESTARDDAGNGSCRILLDRCDGLADAFRNADVLAAYSDQDEVLGSDPRIWDGSVLMIEREDGTRITVGEGCHDAPDCTPIPAGVAALRAALDELPLDHYAFPADAGAGLCR